MAKIEDLTELLVSELSEFEKGIAKLEVLEKRINNTKIEVNLKELQPIIAAHESAMIVSKQHQEHYLNRLEMLLENAKVYPKWAIITFMVLILITCISIFYVYTVKSNALIAEETAYENGKNTASEHINKYLSENPKAFESYKKWAESK
tara:strand:- start:7308 stop:7754 length:447 start_codon:yes stop_codon:yes gene_type:complete